MVTTANPDFIIKAFKAVDNHDLSLKFFEGHNKVLTQFGIENLNTAEPSWIMDPNVYVAVVLDSSGSVFGGLRVHQYNGQTNLPLIEALVDIDPKILEVFARSLPKGTAEVCGLWNDRKIFGKGLSALLCITSVVMVTRIGLDDFYCFSAPYTEKMIKTNGCLDVIELGNQGRFNYPTEEFISAVLYNPDVHKLEFADEFNISRIRSLVQNPHQVFTEKSPRGEIIVEYDINI